MQKPVAPIKQQYCKLFIEPPPIYQLQTIDGPSISNNSLYTTINHLSKSYYNPHWCTNIQNCNNSHRGEYTKQQYTFFLDFYYELQRETTLKVDISTIHSNTNFLFIINNLHFLVIVKGDHLLLPYFVVILVTAFLLPPLPFSSSLHSCLLFSPPLSSTSLVFFVFVFFVV